MWPFREKEIIRSNKKYSDYLPVGTIVKLYNDDQEYMIYRYLGNACVTFKPSDSSLKKSRIYSKNKEDKYKRYNVDYSLIPYPIGIILYEINAMHEDIEEVLHLGYDDDFRKNILRDIDEWHKEGEQNG